MNNYKKKMIATSLLLLGVVFLAGCGQKPVSQTQSTPSDSVAQDSTANQPSVAPVEKGVATNSACGQVKDDSGITYGTVIAEDGKCWLDRNLGATEVATSSTDEASYGWYFQWGRGADGHQIPISEATSTLISSDNLRHANFITSDTSDWHSPQNDKLWQEVGGKNNPCLAGFRVPTQAEWDKFVSSAGITNFATAYGSSLKLPSAGFRNSSDAGFSNQGSGGYYWSSSPNGSLAYLLGFDSGGATPAYNDYRAIGFSVRCVKD